MLLLTINVPLQLSNLSIFWVTHTSHMSLPEEEKEKMKSILFIWTSTSFPCPWKGIMS